MTGLDGGRIHLPWYPMRLRKPALWSRAIQPSFAPMGDPREEAYGGAGIVTFVVGRVVVERWR